MGKSRKPLSAWKKKQRITPGLKRFNEERRKIADSRKENVSDEQSLTSVPGTPCTSSTSVCGRRIVDINNLWEQLKTLGNHGPLGCTQDNIVLVREKRLGLKSCFIFKCNFCNVEQSVWSEIEKPDVMDVNTSAVSGTITTGGGHTQLEEILTTMNIPSMSDKTFRKFEIKICDGLMSTAAQEMKKAAEEEAQHARELGDIDKDGTPLITVVADGSWCKRSYRTNYSSLSGVAAIVGHHTKKVLFMSVKDKYCTPCARAQSRGEEPKQHACYKNWNVNQSSSSMEPAIIADGFTCSEEMYGIRYTRLIADGDSSVYKKILECRPYKSTTVEKIECKNHLLRNFCTKLRQIVTTANRSKNTIVLRKKIGDNILRCRVAVSKATQYRKDQDVTDTNKQIQELRQDILNIPSHVFGEHKQCKDRGYFCDAQPECVPSKSNLVPDLTSVGLYQQVTEVFKELSRHCRSLMADVTSNSVEHYNSIVAKYIGGKRINFALRGSYQGRCSAAVIQHNSGDAHYVLHKNMYLSSPGYFTKKSGAKRKRKVETNKGKKKCKRSLFSSSSCSISDKDYGPAAQRPDLDEDVLRSETVEFLQNLKKSKEEIHQIERDTVHQSDTGLWLQTRRNLLTASNFGRVCKMKPSTGCESLVKQLLYSSFDCEAMAYGRKHENNAKDDISAALGITINECGLFIDEDHPFLGASPDGLVNEDGLVEIKCPSSGKNLTPDEAILSRKVTFWQVSKDNQIKGINTKHNFYYQIQGQLHITRRKYCIFVLWTPKGLKMEYICRNEDFWAKEMLPRLEKFYMNCVLPELVDPRYKRSMPIRNPNYILEAKELAEQKRNPKKPTA